MRKPLTTAIVAAVLIVVSLFCDSTPLWAQEPERTPGPIIEDPGRSKARTYVAPRANLSAGAIPLSTFVVTYNGFTPQAQAAFQAAVDVWAAQIQSNVPIRVTANWTSLGPGILGSAGPKHLFRSFPGAPNSSTWFPVAIANKLSGVDLAPNDDDIVANFNSSFGWYLGTDGNAGAQFDLMTIVLHELGHGLGFLGSMNGAGDQGYWGGVGYPYAYDRYAFNGAGQALLNTQLFANPSAALGGQLISNNIFFNGTNALSANGGSAPKLYAPNPWVSGSSYSHLDESTYPNGSVNSLMTPALGPGEAVHDPGPIVRGMFLDMGWTLSAPPNSVITGDWDSDGQTDITVYRPSTAGWWILRSSTNFTNYSVYGWGGIGDTPVPGDYDGDGKTDLAIYRPSNSEWWILWSRTNYGSYGVYGWGLGRDIPVPADYDGDGKIDIAVFRPSNSEWWILRSSSNFGTYNSYTWGVSGDVPALKRP